MHVSSATLLTPTPPAPCGVLPVAKERQAEAYLISATSKRSAGDVRRGTRRLLSGSPSGKIWGRPRVYPALISPSGKIWGRPWVYPALVSQELNEWGLGTGGCFHSKRDATSALKNFFWVASLALFCLIFDLIWPIQALHTKVCFYIHHYKVGQTFQRADIL